MSASSPRSHSWGRDVAIPADDEPQITAQPIELAPRPDVAGNAGDKMQAHTADAPLCYSCGSKMQPAGSCYVCSSCGCTSGCS